MKVSASFKDMFGEKSTKELLLLKHHSPSQHHLKVWTSTKDAKVLSSHPYFLYYIKYIFLIGMHLYFTGGTIYSISCTK